MIQSLLNDGTCSWVMLVSGINKYVTEMTEETHDDHIDYIGKITGKPVAKARPKQTSSPTTSSTPTLPHDQRDWIDVEPGLFSRRRRNSRIQNLGIFRNYVFSAFGQFEHG